MSPEPREARVDLARGTAALHSASDTAGTTEDFVGKRKEITKPGCSQRRERGRCAVDVWKPYTPLQPRGVPTRQL